MASLCKFLSAIPVNTRAIRCRTHEFVSLSAHEFSLGRAPAIMIAAGVVAFTLIAGGGASAGSLVTSAQSSAVLSLDDES